jgi:3-oxoacyl-[acyl-carrier-protein] synthase II
MSGVAITGGAVVGPATFDGGPGVARFVVEADRPPPLDHLPEAVRARAARTERLAQLALGAAGGALADRTLADPARAGIVLGTAFGCFLTNDAHERRVLAEGPAGASPRLFAATVSNAAAGEVAIAYRLAGPSVTLTAGAASGLAALGHAADVLEGGQADLVLAGGVDAAGPALARWLDAAALAIGRPAREGAALLVLERDAGAAPTLGTIASYAGGFEPAASGDGLAAAIAAACEAAGVAPASLRLVVAAAPPSLADRERRGLMTAGAGSVRVVVPKDELGETFGAAGPLGLLLGLAGVGAGEHVLVLDVCATGHVGALVARRAR